MNCIHALYQWIYGKSAKLEESFLRFIKDRFRHSMTLVSFLENECFSQESVLSQQRI